MTNPYINFDFITNEDFINKGLFCKGTGIFLEGYRGEIKIALRNELNNFNPRLTNLHLPPDIAAQLQNKLYALKGAAEVAYNNLSEGNLYVDTDCPGVHAAVALHNTKILLQVIDSPNYSHAHKRQAVEVYKNHSLHMSTGWRILLGSIALWIGVFIISQLSAQAAAVATTMATGSPVLGALGGLSGLVAGSYYGTKKTYQLMRYGFFKNTEINREVYDIAKMVEKSVEQGYYQQVDLANVLLANAVNTAGSNQNQMSSTGTLLPYPYAAYGTSGYYPATQSHNDGVHGIDQEVTYPSIPGYKLG